MMASSRAATQKTAHRANEARHQTTDATTLIQHFLSEGKIKEVLESQVRYFLFWKLLSTQTEESAKSSNEATLDFPRRWHAPLAPTSVEGVDAALLTRIVDLQEKEGKPTLHFKAFVSLVLDWLKAYGFVHAAGVLRPEASLRDSDLLTDEEQLFVLGLPRSLLAGSLTDGSTSRCQLAPLLERALTLTTMLQSADNGYISEKHTKPNLGKPPTNGDFYPKSNTTVLEVIDGIKTAGNDTCERVAEESAGQGRGTAFRSRAGFCVYCRPLSVNARSSHRWNVGGQRCTAMRGSSSPPSMPSSRVEPLFSQPGYEHCSFYLDRHHRAHGTEECRNHCDALETGKGTPEMDVLLDKNVCNWFNRLVEGRLKSLEKEYSEKMLLLQRVHAEALQARKVEADTARRTIEAAQQAKDCFIEMQRRQAQAETKLEITRKAIEQRAMELDMREKQLSEVASSAGHLQANEAVQERDSKLNGRLQQLQAMLDQAQPREPQHSLQKPSHERRTDAISNIEFLAAATDFREKIIEQEARLARSQLETEDLRAQLLRAQQSRLATEAQLQRMGAYASSLTTEHEASVERIRQDLERKYSHRMQEVQAELQKALAGSRDRDARFKLLVAELEGMRREKADVERSAARLKKLYGAAKAARVHQKRLANSVARALNTLDLDASPPSSLGRGSTACVRPSTVDLHQDTSPAGFRDINCSPGITQKHSISSSQRVCVTGSAGNSPWNRQVLAERWDLQLQPSSFTGNAVGIQRRVESLMECFVKQAQNHSVPKDIEQCTRKVTYNTFAYPASGSNDRPSKLNAATSRGSEGQAEKQLWLEDIQNGSAEWRGKYTEPSMEGALSPRDFKSWEGRELITCEGKLRCPPFGKAACRAPKCESTSEGELSFSQRQIEAGTSVCPTSGITATVRIPETRANGDFTKPEHLPDVTDQRGKLEQPLTQLSNPYSATCGDQIATAPQLRQPQNKQPRQNSSPPAIYRRENGMASFARSDKIIEPLDVQEESNDMPINSSAAGARNNQKRTPVSSTRSGVAGAPPGGAPKHLSCRETSQETAVPECGTLVSGTWAITANSNNENVEKLGCNRVPRSAASNKNESVRERRDSGPNMMRQIMSGNNLDAPLTNEDILASQREKAQDLSTPTSGTVVTKAKCVDLDEFPIYEHGNTTKGKYPPLPIPKCEKSQAEAEPNGKVSQVYAVSSHSPASGARLLLNADAVPLIGVDNDHESLTPAEAAASSRIATSPWEDASLASSLPHSPAVLSGFPSLLCPVAPACEAPTDDSSISRNVVSSLEAGEVGCYLPLPSRRWSSTQEVNLAALSDNESFPSLSPLSTSARHTSG